MSDTRITRTRKIFIEYISAHNESSFSELKANLVGKWPEKMDATTLYRMIETFKKQWLIHEANRHGERIIFLAGADYTPGYDAVTISVCDHCGHIETKYSELPDNFSESFTENRLETCAHCENA